MIALDASALLVFLFREPGHPVVASHIGRSCMSTVNLAEVIGKFVERGVEADAVVARLLPTPIELVPFDTGQAARAALLLPSTRPRGLSLADRACLALAADRGITALTADSAWAEIDLGIDIELVR